jgi:predicted XRE-type DNA-binding protein
MSESEKSSGNIFADLGVENSEEELAKAKMAYAISRIIKERGLTQTQAAQILGTNQARVSDIVNAKVTSISYDRLIKFLRALEYTVTFEIVPIREYEQKLVA